MKEITVERICLKCGEVNEVSAENMKQIEKLQKMLEKENNRLCIMYEESELKKE